MSPTLQILHNLSFPPNLQPNLLFLPHLKLQHDLLFPPHLQIRRDLSFLLSHSAICRLDSFPLHLQIRYSFSFTFIYKYSAVFPSRCGFSFPLHLQICHGFSIKNSQFVHPLIHKSFSFFSWNHASSVRRQVCCGLPHHQIRNGVRSK